MTSLLRWPPAYRAHLLWRTGAWRPRGHPELQRMNAALRTDAEADRAYAEVGALGLPAHPERVKNWDGLAALDVVLRATTTEARVLDAGAERYSTLLPSLFLYGYRDLHGLNLGFTQAFRHGPIQYRPGDITRAPYPDAHFDAITCLSVIEHGVDLEALRAEMRRLLAPGGLLVVSTDYFDTPTDTGGRVAYGVPIHVFDRTEMEAFVERARVAGLEPTSEPDLTCRDRVVHWRRQNLRFTFLVLAFRRTA